MAKAVTWSKSEEKAFENAIALHWTDQEDDSKDMWREIADMVPSKSLADLKLHFQLLMEDVNDIEAGIITVPNYAVDETTSSSSKDSLGSDRKLNCGYTNGVKRDSPKASKADQERRKGVPWSEEEHRLFLLGLDKFGKGDWRSISRNFVVSRTPTQVASHAQKYFIRMNSMNRERRRSSIHDITNLNNGEASSQQAPITGQQGSPSPVPPPANLGALSMYGTPVGHPVAAPPGHMASAVGTPVMLPPHHPPPYLLPVAYPVGSIPPAPIHGGGCVAS